MNRVRNLRLEKGLTQQKLAIDLHVSQQYISKIENGASTMTEDIILRLSRYFHVSIAYLLGASDVRTYDTLIEDENSELQEWMNYYYDLNYENHNTVSALSQYLIQKQKTKNDNKEINNKNEELKNNNEQQKDKE